MTGRRGETEKGKPPISGSPRHPLIHWLPVLAWAGMIYYFSSLPNLRITQAWYDIVLRKLAHLFVFGVLATLFSRAFRANTAWLPKKVLMLSLFFTFLYACTDEYHQTFVTGRTGSLLDIGIDGFGAWLALHMKSS